MNIKKIIFIFCLIIYLIIAFGTEYFYRDKLYDISIKYIENIKQDGFFHYFYFFWSMVFLILIIIFGILITLLFYPISIFFSFLSIQIILSFIMCILKSVYSNPRPFWDIYLKNEKNETEKLLPTPTECDGGFGNPSGHSLSATYILCLWNLFINSNYFKKIEGKKKIFIKYFTLVLSIICILFITYSRVNRQIHSFNQIIFGAILGFAVFFTFCYILEINAINPKTFMENLNNYKYLLIPILFVLFAISAILGFIRHNGKENEYFIILEKYCGYKKEELFGNSTILLSPIIFIIIGSYIGLLLLRYKIKKNFPNKENAFYNWNTRGQKFQIIKIAFLSFFLPFIFPISIIFINYKFIILKFILAIIFYFLYGFLSIGIFFYYACIYYKKEEFVDEELLINKQENEEENTI